MAAFLSQSNYLELHVTSEDRCHTSTNREKGELWRQKSVTIISCKSFLSLKLQKGHRHGLAHARIGDFQHFNLPKVFSSRHGDQYSRTLECCQGV